MSYYQEGLPAYWGIETDNCLAHKWEIDLNQEGLPDYWGIETGHVGSCTCIVAGDSLSFEYIVTGGKPLSPSAKLSRRCQ